MFQRELYQLHIVAYRVEKRHMCHVVRCYPNNTPVLFGYNYNEAPGRKLMTMLFKESTYILAVSEIVACCSYLFSCFITCLSQWGHPCEIIVANAGSF